MLDLMKPFWYGIFSSKNNSLSQMWFQNKCIETDCIFGTSKQFAIPVADAFSTVLLVGHNYKCTPSGSSFCMCMRANAFKVGNNVLFAFGFKIAFAHGIYIQLLYNYTRIFIMHPFRLFSMLSVMKLAYR